jgi:uncharacterized protein YggE
MPKHKMEKSVQLTLIIVAAVVLLIIGAIIYFRYNSTQNTIQINGQATVHATPDLITVYFNVNTKGATSKEAEDANSLIVSRLTDSIIALGFSESDLKTESYNIYPNYDYSGGTQRITGYTATDTLKVQTSTDNKGKIGSIIDAGTNAGAGISYINFELSPSLQQQYKTQAIKQASDDARVKAEAVAAGFNKKLVRLVAVSLDQYNYYPRNIYTASSDSSGMAGGAEAKSAVASITPSESDVTASVTATYKI